MPPDVWVVMGDAQVGKSTTIRALTGVYKSDYTNVQMVQRTLNRIYVQVRSLQEKGIRPSVFINAHNNDRYILLSLRIKKRANCPNGLKYLQEFLSHNWDIREIVVLGTNILPYNLPIGVSKPTFIPNSRSIPPNQVAHQIRSAWDWL